MGMETVAGRDAPIPLLKKPDSEKVVGGRGSPGAARSSCNYRRTRTRGVCEAVNAVPVPTKDTASVELTSAAEGAATAKPEALGPCAGGKARQGCELGCREKGRARV